MYGESPCTGNLIGDIWVTVTASTSSQREGREGVMSSEEVSWWFAIYRCTKRLGDRNSRQGHSALATKMIPRQSCKQNTICSWQSLRVPSLYEHMGMPQQQQLLMRAWNTARFSNSLLNFISLFLGVFCFYREGMKWCRVSSALKAASSHYFKLKECQFRSDIKKVIFTMVVVKYWHRLPGEVVGPSKHLRPGWTGLWATNTMSLMSLLIAGGWTGRPWTGLFQLKLFYDYDRVLFRKLIIPVYLLEDSLLNQFWKLE